MCRCLCNVYVKNVSWDTEIREVRQNGPTLPLNNDTVLWL